MSTQPSASLPTPVKAERISDIMRRLMDGASGEECVSIGHILHIFGVRGFAFLLLILSLLNIVIFMVPFISILFGVPMVILAAQMVLGLQAPIFPQFVRHQTISRAPLMKGLNIAIGWVSKVEHAIKPRGAILSDRRLTRVHGIFALILAMMVALPIPLFNIPPSVSLVLLALGILQRDGLFIASGYGMGLISMWLFKSTLLAAHSSLT